MKYRLLRRASDEFFQILDNAAEHRGQQASDALGYNLVDAFRRIAADPGIGHTRSDFTGRPFHFHFADPYYVVYRRQTIPLEIIAIVHSSRDLPKVLKSL